DVLAIDLRDLSKHRQAGIRRIRWDPLELGAKKIGEVVERPARSIEALEVLACLLVVRLRAKKVSPLLDGLLRVRAFFGERRDLPSEARAFGTIGHGALRIGQDLNEALLLALLLAPLAEEVEHPRMRCFMSAQSLEVRLGRFRLVPHLPIDHRDLED